MNGDIMNDDKPVSSAMPIPVYDHEILSYLKWKYEKGDLINIRVLMKTGGAKNKLFKYTDEKSLTKIIEYIRDIENKQPAAAMAYWCNLQHIKPDAKPKNDAVTDDDIDRINYIGLDIDAIPRIKGKKGKYNSTNQEKSDAVNLMHEILSYLYGFGWPKPCMKDSSNAGQCEFKTNLKREDSETINAFLKMLSWKFDPLRPQLDKYNPSKKDTPELKEHKEQSIYDINCKRMGDIDEALSTLGRMIKIPGTPARKGEDTLERPQRPARLISLGDAKTVSIEQIRAVIEDLKKYEPKEAPRTLSKKGKTDDKGDPVEKAEGFLKHFIDEHKIKISRRDDDTKYIKYILEPNTSPCAGNHTQEDGPNTSSCAIIILKNDTEMNGHHYKAGMITYKCQHDHCNDFSWTDFRAYYDRKFDLTRTVLKKAGIRANEKKQDTQISDNAYIIELMNAYKFVKDQVRDLYVIIDADTNPRILRADTLEFQGIVSDEFFKIFGKAPSMKNIKEAMLQKYGETKDARRLTYRINAEHMDDDKLRAIYYDLCNEQGRAVRVTPGHVEIVPKPLVFKNTGEQAEQVSPDMAAADINKLIDCFDVNISFMDPNTISDEGEDITKTDDYNVLRQQAAEDIDDIKLLLAVYVIYNFIPDTPEHPLTKPGLNINGAKGSGKTTLSRKIKDFIDPINGELTQKPARIGDLEVMMSKSYFAALDQTSELTQEESDLICGCATGVNRQKRTLYFNTDTTDIMLRLGVLINGIASVIKRSDAADRYIFLNLKRIEDNQRKTPAEIMEKYNRERPAIMGGIFKTLAKALELYPSKRINKELAEKSRMASFDEWGYAIAEAIKEGNGKRFLDIYKKVRSERDADMINENLVSMAIANYMESMTKSKLIPLPKFREDLLKLLTNPDGLNISRRRLEDNFPATSGELYRELLTVQSDLISIGIKMEITNPNRKNRGQRTRNIRLYKPE